MLSYSLPTSLSHLYLTYYHKGLCYDHFPRHNAHVHEVDKQEQHRVAKQNAPDNAVPASKEGTNCVVRLSGSSSDGQ